MGSLGIQSYMMATTHIFAGMGLAFLATLLYPEQATLLLLSGAAGGLLPDLDMIADHRRTLHYPVYFSVGALPFGLIALVHPTPWTVAAVVFVSAAALHSVSDIIGGSREPRPWRATCDQAVYNHYHQRWENARRILRYDGSPEDLGVASALAVPLYFTAPDAVQPWILVALIISIVYTALRKPGGEFLAKYDF